MNDIIELIRTEIMQNDRGGIYGYFQRTLTYNSNKIEGSKLTPDQTSSLFETRTLEPSADEYRAKDIEEATGHFVMFNNMLKTIEQPLSEDMIKSYHYDLKSGVFEDKINGYKIGDYKKRANTVNNIMTTLPEEVPLKMKKLIDDYSEIEKPSLGDIVIFHSEYEKIHPFQDGNGRTGRIIMFRESLKYDYLPIIIRDETKDEYRRALKKSQVEQDYTELIGYVRKEQIEAFEEYKAFLTPEIRAKYEELNSTQK